MKRSSKPFAIFGKTIFLKSADTIPCVLDGIRLTPELTLSQDDFVKDVSNDDLWIKYHALPPSPEILEKYKISAELFSQIAEEMATLLTTPCDFCGECITHY